MLALTIVAALSMGRLDSPVTDRVEKLTQKLYQQAGSPRAAATLVRLEGFLDEVDDLNLLAQPYAVMLSRRTTDPFVRTLARVFYADVERARGRTQSRSSCSSRWASCRTSGWWAASTTRARPAATSTSAPSRAPT